MTGIDSEYSRDIFLLRIYYNTLFQILNEFFRGDILVLTEEINKDYLRVCSRISTILKKQEFEQLKTSDWKPYSNLLVFDEYSFEEEWDFEKYPHVCNFLTQVETLFIEESEQEYSLNKEEAVFLTKIQTNFQKFAVYKKQKETDLFNSNPFKNFADNDKMFHNISEKNAESKKYTNNTKESDILIPIRDIAVLFGHKQGRSNIDFILEPYNVAEINNSNKSLNEVKKIEIALRKFYDNKEILSSFLQSLIKFHYSLNKTEILTFNESLFKLGLCLNDNKINIIGITGTEPTILHEVYEKVIDIIYNSGTDIERRVNSHKDRDESELRDVLLSSLNTHRDLFSSGESLNNKGKTDILVYSKGEIVFIAECKIWRGKVSFKEAINQLISLYLTWHDNKVSLIIFNRNKGYYQILDKIPALATSFGKEYNFSCEYLSDYTPYTKNAFRFLLNSKNEDQRRIMLTILVFNLYAE